MTGSEVELHRDYIVPKSPVIRPECGTYDVIHGIHNQIWACGGCNCLKGTKGLYEFYRAKFPGERNFYNLIPPLLEKKYLKTIFNCHQCAETLDSGDLDHDDELTVLDVDFTSGRTTSNKAMSIGVHQCQRKLKVS